MHVNLDVKETLSKLSLHNLKNDLAAGLIEISLPLPPKFPTNLVLTAENRKDDEIIYRKKIGKWIAESDEGPRRLLLISDGCNNTPATLNLAQLVDSDDSAGIESHCATDVSLELIETCQDPGFAWERHMAVISWQDKKIGLMMGLRTGDEVHWWEACRMTILDEQPACKEIEIGGAIPLDVYDSQDLKSCVGYENPYLHKHNWLNGNLYARLHHNGVCEVFAHHINSKFFDDGLDLKNAVPVIGIKVFADKGIDPTLPGSWTGDKTSVRMGDATFDLSDARHLATAEKPGRFDRYDDLVVWQPYEGFELYGGAAPKVILNNEFIFKAEDKIIPRGMARTVRFSFSLSDRSPAVARYIAPAWWYGICEEFLPDSLLPVSNAYDTLIEGARTYIRQHTVRGGFEDGSVPRNNNQPGNSGLCEPGWEGEMPGGQFLCAWRTGNGEDYDLAMRSAYVFTDVYVDHAVKQVRMHGFPPPGISVPMNRIHGPVFAYLETGDPYLLRTSRAVIDTAYMTHKNSWPRLCVGRDACFIRGAVLLYRYFNDTHYQELAKDAIQDVVVSQKTDGSFGDQGGGTGVHQWAAYITKPWMGLMAIGGLIDYLELHPNEPAVLAAVRKFADWLMKERFAHLLPQSGQSVLGWSYQHYFKDDIHFRQSTADQWKMLKQPDDPLWHVEYLARVLGFCSITFDDPAYLDAWAESYEASYSEDPLIRGDHAAVQIFQYIPWLQARLWNARLTEAGVAVEPVRFGDRTVRKGTIMTPHGSIEMAF